MAKRIKKPLQEAAVFVRKKIRTDKDAVSKSFKCLSQEMLISEIPSPGLASTLKSVTRS